MSRRSRTRKGPHIATLARTRAVQACLATLLLTVAFAFTAASAAQREGAAAPPGDAAPPAQVERGAKLYLEHHCGACHALRVLDTHGIFGPPHDAAGVIAAARIADPRYRGAATSAAEYLRESLVDPAAYVVAGYGMSQHRMPAYSLPEEDLDALVSFLLSLDGSAPGP